MSDSSDISKVVVVLAQQWMAELDVLRKRNAELERSLVYLNRRLEAIRLTRQWYRQLEINEFEEAYLFDLHTQRQIHSLSS